MTLKDVVEKKFASSCKEDRAEILQWICKAWECDEMEEMSDKDIEIICDQHYEANEDEMFNWIHDGHDETPSEIHRAYWVTDAENILICKNGGCYFWYSINN